jgi:hypothetical protein
MTWNNSSSGSAMWGTASTGNAGWDTSSSGFQLWNSSLEGNTWVEILTTWLQLVSLGVTWEDLE